MQRNKRGISQAKAAHFIGGYKPLLDGAGAFTRAHFFLALAALYS
jgi:hypothetical protein